MSKTERIEPEIRQQQVLEIDRREPETRLQGFVPDQRAQSIESGCKRIVIKDSHESGWVWAGF